MIAIARPVARRPLSRLLLGLGVLACLSTAAAGEPTILEQRYPAVQQLLLAHDVLQARAYEEVVLTNESPSAAIGQRMLLDKLAELEEAQTSHSFSSR